MLKPREEKCAPGGICGHHEGQAPLVSAQNCASAPSAPRAQPQIRTHLDHPPCRGPCPGSLPSGAASAPRHGEAGAQGVGQHLPLAARGALWKGQHLCVFEERQELTGSCNAVGPGDWPPAAIC